ncbi:DNA/RNA non-specific endonuclease [Furfurilactobacillus entadae]|uniref:endonuclease n=1 Tax=Furfurilactobacillus entadae TaxID=2922307 RepID=UPI0035F06050
MKKRSRTQHKFFTLLTTLIIVLGGYYLHAHPQTLTPLVHATGVKSVTHKITNSAAKLTKATPAATAKGAKVPQDATDSQLLALTFDAKKYPENYANLGKATLTKLQIKDAVNHSNGNAWYSVDPLDSLGRSGAGQALVTYDSVNATSKMKRPPFAESADPSGYKGNNRIAQLTGYRGYFYNRSHTLAWSLVGNLGGGATSSNAIMQRANLTTGTRAQNVGTNGRSTSTAGGMAYAETAIRTFVRNRPNIPVYYVVTPLYQGSELVPRGTHVQAISATDDGAGLNINVYVFNNQAGATINYATGSWTTGS